MSHPGRYHIRQTAIPLFSLLALLVGQTALAARPEVSPGRPVSGVIESFDLLTADQGWLLADGRLYVTSDCGTSWSDRTPSGSQGLSVVAFSFPDPANGFVALAARGVCGLAGLALVRTSDGGKTWSSVPLPADEAGAHAAPTGAVRLRFLDAHTGWLAVELLTSSNFSHGRLFATHDGGGCWSEVSLPIGGAVAFSSPLDGWTAGGASGDALFRTQDGGLTWIDQSPSPNRNEGTPETGMCPTPFQGEDWDEDSSLLFQLPTLAEGGRALLPASLSAPDGDSVLFYISSDSGRDWQLALALPAAAEPAPGVVVPVAPLDAQRWLARLPGGETLLRIEPSGTQPSGWTATAVGQGPTVAAISALDMAEGRAGWALTRAGRCDPECHQESALLRTEDGGATWTQVVPVPSAGGAGPGAGRQPPSLLGPGGIEGSHARPVIGHGFDTCEAPSLAALEVWSQHSPYRTINLYIGGVNRACDNVRLSLEYVEEATDQGWTFIPTWVGLQAACWGYSGAKMSLDPAVAYDEGTAEAEAALDTAVQLGLAGTLTDTVIYFDLEAYNTANQPCRQAAKSFIQGWTERLQALGQVAGAYGAGCASAPSDWATLPSPPNALWAAHWLHPYFFNPDASVWNVACLDNSLWSNHQRLRQYTGGHNEEWGGTTLNIDCDVLDGTVSDLRYHWRCPPDEPCWRLYVPGIFVTW